MTITELLKLDVLDDIRIVCNGWQLFFINGAWIVRHKDKIENQRFTDESEAVAAFVKAAGDRSE